MIAYLDSSALVKLVFREAETPALRAAISSWDTLVTSALADVELMRVAHRGGPGHVTRAREVLDGLYVIALGPAILRSAGNLLPGSHLRTLDAIHLAAATSIGELGLVCTYDSRMINAARALGLHCQFPRADRG